MGGKGSSRRHLGIVAYWAKFTPEQRSQMMIQRRAKAKRKLIARLRGREAPSTESPFEEASPAITSSSRSLKALLADLENVVSELKTMFGV